MPKSRALAIATPVKPPVKALDKSAARRLTDEIRSTAEHVWALLLEAYERRAWSALSYESWAAYVKAEFGYSRTHSYKILDHAVVLREVEGAVKDAQSVLHVRHPNGVAKPEDKPFRRSTIVDASVISERQARTIKPHIGSVTQIVRDKVAGVAPERVNAIVSDVVEKEVAKIRRHNAEVDEANAWVHKVNASAPPGFDAEEDRRIGRVKTAALDLLRKITEQPDPAEVVALLVEEERKGGEIIEMSALNPALAWLTAFSEAWYAR